VNALRAFNHELNAPLAIMAGLYGRELDLAPEDSPKSSVRLCMPVLDALEVRHVLVEGPADAPLIAETLGSVFETGRTAVVLIGAPTS
jgi:hypothetical protein